MPIAVTGATGQLGQFVIEKLLQRAAVSDIVALARTPAKAAGLSVAVRTANYDRPETLGQALSDVDTLLLISSSEVGKRIMQHRSVIDEAVRAGSRAEFTSLPAIPVGRWRTSPLKSRYTRARTFRTGTYRPTHMRRC